MSRFLHEKLLLEDKLKINEQATNGLELRVRKTIEFEYQGKIKSIEEENKQLKKIFI